MRRYLHVPQISAVMGSCIAGGAYLPALSDVIFMVEGTSFMGLGGPNLVKGATGQTIDAETLGGAKTHTEISAVAHYRAANDAECLQRIREYVGRLPADRRRAAPGRTPVAAGPAARPTCTTSCRRITGMSYDMRQVLALPARRRRARRVPARRRARDDLRPRAHRGLAGRGHRQPARRDQGRSRASGPRFGGIIYTESAEKVGLLHRDGEPRAAAASSSCRT